MSESSKGAEDDMGAAFAQGMVDALTCDLKLTLYEDMTFSMSIMGMPAEGSWKIQRGNIRLEMESMMGMSREQIAEQDNAEDSDFEEPMILEIEEDGNRLSVVQQGDEEDIGEMYFTRSS
ncbi:MAG: hypothetical protein ACOCX1_06580 [Fimbriimonadaceae bacterium]